jgi:squalene-hopene/tetraprenyl-beta-curcumene cyclase
MKSRFLICATCLLFLALAHAAEPMAKAKPKPPPVKADEPIAKTVSMDKAISFLDTVAAEWTTGRKCGTCHTNVPYLIARPALTTQSSDEEKLVRTFFEERVKNWDRGEKGDKPRWDTEVVVTGATLAFHDAATTKKLHPLTKTALDRMWKIQQKNGAWNWLKCDWPPLEHDDYYGAVFAAVAVGLAPNEYAKGESAKTGLAKLKEYLSKTPAPSLHHKAWLLWGSKLHEGLMSEEEQKKTINELLALQRKDGGWSLPSLGDWKGNDGRKNDTEAESDGYGTGMVVVILRKAGVKSDDGAITRAVQWLKANQRNSGRWYTKSLNSDRQHFIANAGTAFSAMALKLCE